MNHLSKLLDQLWIDYHALNPDIQRSEDQRGSAREIISEPRVYVS